MLVLVTYDVSTADAAGRRRLRQVAKTLQNQGVRVQLSVFECEVEPARWVALRAKLEKLMDPQTDSLRFYFLGSERRHRVEHVGAKPASTSTASSFCSPRIATRDVSEPSAAMRRPGRSRVPQVIDGAGFPAGHPAHWALRRGAGRTKRGPARAFRAAAVGYTASRRPLHGGVD